MGTGWSRLRGHATAAETTTAHARVAHAQGWPSLPAAEVGASRHEIAHAPAAIDALSAGIRQPEVRAAARSMSRRTRSASVVITVQWWRPLDTASAGGRSCRWAEAMAIDERWTSGNDREREHHRLQVPTPHEEGLARRK